MGREGALAASPRIAIDTPSVDGSIALQGARIDDLNLRGFRRTVERDSGEETLFSPEKALAALGPEMEPYYRADTPRPSHPVQTVTAFN